MAGRKSPPPPRPRRGAGQNNRVIGRPVDVGAPVDMDGNPLRNAPARQSTPKPRKRR